MITLLLSPDGNGMVIVSFASPNNTSECNHTHKNGNLLCFFPCLVTMM